MSQVTFGHVSSTGLNTRSRRMQSYDPRYSFNRGLIGTTGIIPEGVQLLQDVYPLKVLDTKKALTESANGRGERGVTRITGIFQEAEKQNANGRIYPYSVMREAIQDIQEDVQNRCVWAEFDHPSDAKIHMDRISHLITKLWMEGNKVIGEAEIIDELPYGHQLKTLLRHGSVGISSRGIGDIEVREGRNGEEYIVTEGFRLVTFDAVAEPSVSGARLNIVEGKMRPLRQVSKPAPIQGSGLLESKHYEKMIIDEFNRHLGL